MPKQSRTIRGEYTFRVSKIVRAPLKYVYAWCTDYRSDDGKFSLLKPRFRVLRLGKNRILRIRTYSDGEAKDRVAVDLIRLDPPTRWHLDEIDEEDLEAVDYRLTALGPRRTRVTLSVTERWMIPNYPSRREVEMGSNAYWDRLVAALESHYRSGRPARG